MHVQGLVTIEAKEKESKSIRQFFNRWHDAEIYKELIDKYIEFIRFACIIVFY